MVRKIDAISIGIGADLSQFKQQLAAAAKLVNETAIPNKVVKVTVRAEIDKKSIEYAKNVITADLRAVAGRQVSFKPRLVATKTNVQDYVKSVNELFVAAANDPTNKLNKGLILKPNVQLALAPGEVEKLRDAIQSQIKAIAVPLTWYWQNGSPPSGAQGGGGGQPPPGGGGGGRGPGTGPRPRYNPGPAGTGGPSPSGGRRGPTTGGTRTPPTGAPAGGATAQGFTSGGTPSTQQQIINAAYATAGTLANAESVVEPMPRRSSPRTVARFERSAAAQQEQAYERAPGFIGPRRPVAGTGVTPNNVRQRRPSPFTLTPSEKRRVEVARQLRDIKFRSSDIVRDFRKSDFGKLSPRIGEAFDAMQAGEPELARDLLRGMLGDLAGADPKQRQRFFDVFNQPTRASGPLLAADAAIRALIYDIGVQTDPNFPLKPSDATIRHPSKPSATSLAQPTKEHPMGQKELKGPDVRRQRLETSRIIEKNLAGMAGLTVDERRAKAELIAKEAKLPYDDVLRRYRRLGIKFRARGGPVGRVSDWRMARHEGALRELLTPGAFVRLKGLDLDEAAEIVRTAQKLFPQFPDVAANISEFATRSWPKEPSGIAKTEGSLRFASRLSKPFEEVLGVDVPSDIGINLAARGRPYKSRPGSFVDPSWRGVTTHEFAHVLDSTRSRGMFPASESLWPRGVPGDVSGLSGYALQGATRGRHAESLAEAFTAYMQGVFEPDSKLARLFAGGAPGSLAGIKARTRAKGGPVGQPYVVGEKGSEIFVPESAGWIIPHHLMEQLPKRADGGGTGNPKREDIWAFLMQNRAFASSQQAMGEPGGPDYRQQREFQRELKNILLGIKPGQPGFKQPAPLPPKIEAQGPIQIEASEPISITSDKAFADLPPAFQKALERAGLTPGSFGGTGGGGGRGGGGGGGGGRPPGPANEGPDPKLSPAEKVAIQIRRELARQQPIERATGLRAEISEQVALSPIRALSVSIGQIFSTLTGRADIIKRGREANALVEMGSHFANIRLATDADILVKEELIAKKRAEGLKVSDEELQVVQDLKEQRDVAAKAEKGFFEEAEVRTKQILPLRAFVGNLVASTAGIVTGTIGFSLALGAAQTAIELTGKALEPVIDRFTGFVGTTNKVTSALNEATTAQSGNARVVVLNAAAQSGMTEMLAAQIGPALQARAAGEAANKNLQTQVDLQRASQRVGSQQIGGADLSAFTPTGGLLGSELLAIPSTFQTIQEQLYRVKEAQPQQIGYGPGSQFPALLQTVNSAMAGPLSPTAAHYLNRPPGETAPNRLDQAREIFEGFNQSILKGGGTTAFKVGNATPAEIEASASAAMEMGREFPALADEAQALAAALRDTKSAIVENGKAVTDGEKVFQTYTAAQRGALRPSANLLIQETQQRREAQIGVIQEMSRRQREQFLPGQRYLQYQQNQPLPVGAGIVPPEGARGFGGFSATLPRLSADFKSFQASAGDALDYVRQRAMEGRKELLGMGVPGDLLDQLDAFSADALRIQKTMADKQAVVTATQYNHQLYIARRSLADARALAGQIAGNERGRLGALERQNVLLDRQSQQLSLQAATLSQMLQQRQINFSVAIAGFQAPGLTSEEREARIQQAKLEAEYAQKQLDIAKQQTAIQRKQINVGIKIFDESNIRAIQDAKFAIADLQAGFQLQMDNAQALQALEAIHQGEGQLMEDINTYFGEYQQLLSGALGEVPEIVAQSGEAFDKVLRQTGRAWNVFVGQAVEAGRQIVTGLSPSSKPGEGGGGGGGSRSMHRAEGFYGSFGTPTTLQVGEAGSETIAIIRNARNMTMGATPSGGGGITLNIMVTGNNVRDEADLDALVAKITNRVERLFQRRGSLLGMRNLTG